MQGKEQLWLWTRLDVVHPTETEMLALSPRAQLIRTTPMTSMETRLPKTGILQR